MIFAVEHFIWRPLERKTEKKVPSIIRRMCSFLILVLAFFAIVAFVFDQKITSLLATSGMIAMIIGLAIQINIANIFSGIILNIDRSLSIGDWIMVHGRTAQPEHGTIGCIVDIGWRTTQLKTTDNALIMLPNSVFSEKTITNFMLPGEKARFELDFCLHFDVPTEEALRVLNQAAQAVVGHPQGPMAGSKAKVRVAGTSTLGVTYRLRYWIIPRLVSPSKARNTILESVLKSLDEAGLFLVSTRHILADTKTNERGLALHSEVEVESSEVA